MSDRFSGPDRMWMPPPREAIFANFSTKTAHTHSQLRGGWRPVTHTHTSAGGKRKRGRRNFRVNTISVCDAHHKYTHRASYTLLTLAKSRYTYCFHVRARARDKQGRLKHLKGRRLRLRNTIDCKTFFSIMLQAGSSFDLLLCTTLTAF